MDGPIYVLDANVFIEAARRYYAFDIAPGFWRNLVHHAENEHIESIDRVKNERSRGKDQLAEWVDGDFSAAFSSTDRSDVIREYAGIMTWANGQYQYFGTASRPKSLK